MAVLFSAGAQVPVIPLVDVVGRAVSGAPEQIGVTAVNVGVIDVLTLTVAVTVQPELFLKVITLDPVETPFTKPVLLTVATAVFDDVHGVVAFGVPVPVN